MWCFINEICVRVVDPAHIIHIVRIFVCHHVSGPRRSFCWWTLLCKAISSLSVWCHPIDLSMLLVITNIRLYIAAGTGIKKPTINLLIALVKFLPNRRFSIKHVVRPCIIKHVLSRYFCQFFSSPHILNPLL